MLLFRLPLFSFEQVDIEWRRSAQATFLPRRVMPKQSIPNEIGIKRVFTKMIPRLVFQHRPALCVLFLFLVLVEVLFVIAVQDASDSFGHLLLLGLPASSVTRYAFRAAQWACAADSTSPGAYFSFI